LHIFNVIYEAAIMWLR